MDDKKELSLYSLYVDPNEKDKLNPSLKLFHYPTPALLNIDHQEYEVRVKYRGNHTRNLPQKSYNLRMTNPRRLFGAREIHLNAEYNDASFIRNKLSLDLFEYFGTLSPTSQHIQLNLNDNYEGVYLQLESVDDLFLKKRQLPPGPIYYGVTNNANFSLKNPFTRKQKESLLLGYQRKLGTSSDDSYLMEFIRKINDPSYKKFGLEIEKYLCIDKYLRWLAVAVCTQNLDGFKKNYALYKNSETGQFEIIPWDYDATFGRDWDGLDLKYNRVPIEGYNTLSKQLLKIPRFRNQYKHLMTELLNTLFTPTFLHPKIISLTQSVRSYIPSNIPLDSFDAEPAYMLKFIENRSRFLRTQLKDLN